jgi:SET domain-containing protein
MRRALELVEVRQSSIHRRGMFARRDIPAGTRVIEYVGRRVSREKADSLCLEQNGYIFSLGEHIDLNGKVSWNPARLINHSCEPNCETSLDAHDRVWVYSIKAIRRGEEITFNYGYTLDNFINHPCRCGAASCVGYMVAEQFFPEVRRMQIL